MTRIMSTAAAAFLCVSAAGHAATIDAEAMLRDFSVIALGGMSGSIHLEGTAYVGGDLTVSGGYYVNSDNLPVGTAGDVSGALIVGGNLSGSGDFTTAGNGNVVVGGSSSIDVNKPVQTGVGTDVPGGVPVQAVRQAFQKLSTTLGSTPATAGTFVDTSDMNDLDVENGNPLDGFSVVNAPVGFLFWGNVNNRFPSLDQTITTIINIPGTIVSVGVNLDATKYANVLLNFYEATSLNITTGLGLSVLAPFADVTVSGGGTYGTLVGLSIDQRTELRPYDQGYNFTGDLPEPSAVPLPAAGWLLLAGLAGLGALHRYRGA